MKLAIGKHWFTLHVLFMIVGTAIASLFGVFYIYGYKQSDHFNNVHAKLGISITAVLIFQILLGIKIHYNFDPKRTRIPVSSIIHWWVGRIVFIAALVNVYFGITLQDYNETSNSVAISSGISVFIGMVMWICGEFFFGQVCNAQC